MKNLSLPTIYVFDIFSHRGAIVKNRQQMLFVIWPDYKWPAWRLQDWAVPQDPAQRHTPGPKQQHGWLSHRRFRQQGSVHQSFRQVQLDSVQRCRVRGQESAVFAGRVQERGHDKDRVEKSLVCQKRGLLKQNWERIELGNFSTTST